MIGILTDRDIVVRSIAEGRNPAEVSVDDVALHSPTLAGEIIEHVRAPERPIVRGPWWESPESR